MKKISLCLICIPALAVLTISCTEDAVPSDSQAENEFVEGAKTSATNIQKTVKNAASKVGDDVNDLGDSVGEASKNVSRDFQKLGDKIEDVFDHIGDDTGE